MASNFLKKYGYCLFFVKDMWENRNIYIKGRGLQWGQRIGDELYDQY